MKISPDNLREINGLEQRLALIRFYFKEAPIPYSDQYFKLWGQLEFALIFDGKMSVTEIKKG